MYYEDYARRAAQSTQELGIKDTGSDAVASGLAAIAYALLEVAESIRKIEKPQ